MIIVIISREFPNSNQTDQNESVKILQKNSV